MPIAATVLGRLQRLASIGLGPICGHALYRVHGHSMRPALGDGDIVLVRTRRKREPEPGDIVVAREPGSGRILIKRVLSRGDSTVYLGSDDPNSGHDSRHFGSLPIATLVGIVTRHVPVGRARRPASPSSKPEPGS